MDIADRLKTTRGDRSLRSVARELGIEPSAYRAWEERFSLPKPQQAQALASYLGITKMEALLLILPDTITEQDLEDELARRRKAKRPRRTPVEGTAIVAGDQRP